VNGSTNVQISALATFVSVALLWLAGYFLPDLMATAPDMLGELFTGALIVAAGLYFQPNAGIKSLPGTGGRLMHVQKTKHFYFLTLFYALLISLGMTMQACSTLGYENVDTTRKAIVVSIAEVRAANFLLKDLVDRRAISSFDAEDALENLQEAHDLLQTALSAVDSAGDPVLAGKNLDRAKIALNLVMALLAPLAEQLEN